MNQPLTHQVKVTITARNPPLLEVAALELDEAGFLQFTIHTATQELMMGRVYSERTESSKSTLR